MTSPTIAMAASSTDLVDAGIDIPGLPRVSYDLVNSCYNKEARSTRSDWGESDLASYYNDLGGLCAVVAGSRFVPDKDGDDRLTYTQTVHIYWYNQNYNLVDKKEIVTPDGVVRG